MDKEVIDMRLSSVDKKLAGCEIAAPVYSPNGLILVNKGTVLTEKSINRILDMGINSVYITDANEEVVLEEVLPVPIRLEVQKKLEKVFDDVSRRGSLDNRAVNDIVEEVIGNINMSENAFLVNNVGRGVNGSALAIHSIDVAVLSIMVGKNKGYDPRKLFNLGTGAILHDIGKLFDSGRGHVKKGYEFVSKTNLFSPTSSVCVYAHHENADGSGYPEGIKGDRIYEFAAIVSICNEYINLYIGQGLMPSAVLEIITAEASKQFDAGIYRDFVQSIYCYPNGMAVRLNNGLEGIIITQNREFPTRPVVRAYVNGVPFRVFALLENPTLFIDSVII
jgi:response regulator RpfG family c-di-GMP phosphodiesterase